MSVYALYHMAAPGGLRLKVPLLPRLVCYPVDKVSYCHALQWELGRLVTVGYTDYPCAMSFVSSNTFRQTPCFCDLTFVH